MEEIFINSFLKSFSAFVTGWFVLGGFSKLTFSTHLHSSPASIVISQNLCHKADSVKSTG